MSASESMDWQASYHESYVSNFNELDEEKFKNIINNLNIVNNLNNKLQQEKEELESYKSGFLTLEEKNKELDNEHRQLIVTHQKTLKEKEY